MANSVQKALGYRDVIYNIKQQQFYTFAEGDNYIKLDIATGGVENGGTGDRPDSPSVGDLFWDTDLEILVIWNGSSWEPVGSGAALLFLMVNQATGLLTLKKVTSILTPLSIR